MKSAIFSNNSDVVPPSEARLNFIFIFDDVVCDKQDAVREYFPMGRHANIDCFCLCQTYAKIPKHLIHDNANLLILFKQDRTNLKYVYNDHIIPTYDHTMNFARLLTIKIWISSDI